MPSGACTCVRWCTVCRVGFSSGPCSPHSAAARSKVKPDWSKGYFRSGCVYEAQKRFEDASLAYWEAAKRDSGVKEYRASFQRALALAKEEYNAQQAAVAAGGASGDAAGAGAGAGASTTGAGAGAGTAAASAEAPAAASATAASGGATPSGEPAAKS